MLRFFSKMFRFKVREYEAKLLPTPNCRYGGRGEIEINCYSDGSATFELSLKHSSVPDGERIEFYCLGSIIDSAISQRGYVKKHIRFNNISDVQDQLLHSEAEIQIRGTALYRGSFHFDS